MITHADHYGDNGERRERAPSVTLAAHEADAALLESVDRIMRERYGMFGNDHGILYDEEVREWLTGMTNPVEPVDLRLRSGERVALGDRDLPVLHTLSHTRGHIAPYDPAYDVVTGSDAFFGRGVFTVGGDYVQPPPYYLYPSTRTRSNRSGLSPDALSPMHYGVFGGDDVERFGTESLDLDLPSVDHGPTAAIVALKLGCMPLLARLVFSLLAVDPATFTVSVVMLGTPTAVPTCVFARELGGDEERASLNVFVTTVAAVGTLVSPDRTRRLNTAARELRERVPVTRRLLAGTPHTVID